MGFKSAVGWAAIWAIGLPFAFAQEQPAAGEKFREVVQLLDDKDLISNIEKKAKEASGREADLIRLLGDVAAQCMSDSDATECQFKETGNTKTWPDMTSYLSYHLERGEFGALGSLFKCGVDKLEGTPEGDYLDCLKQAELQGLRFLPMRSTDDIYFKWRLSDITLRSREENPRSPQALVTS